MTAIPTELDDRTGLDGGSTAPVAWMRRHRNSVGVVLAALLLYGYAWSVQPNRPELGSVRSAPEELFVVTETGYTGPEEFLDAVAQQAKQLGWYGAWFDQYHYGQMARALARFDLPGTSWDADAGRPLSGEFYRSDKAAYAYGLGYPLLAAPFVWAGFGGDPYVVLDGILFAFAALIALWIMRQFLAERVAVIAVLALLCGTPFVRYFVIPYGTSVTVVAVLAAIWILVAPRVRTGDIALVAIATALCAASRYVDGLWPVLLIIAAVLLRRPRARQVAVASAALLVVTGAVVAWTHQVAFGSVFDTPYSFHNDGLGTSSEAFAIGRIPSSFVGVFLSGDRSMLFGVDPVLRVAPWFILAPVGLWLLVRRGHSLRGPVVAVTIVAIAATGLYCAWWWGGVRDLKVWNIRFYHSWFPLYTLLSAIAIVELLGPSRRHAQVGVVEGSVAHGRGLQPDGVDHLHHEDLDHRANDAVNTQRPHLHPHR